MSACVTSSPPTRAPDHTSSDAASTHPACTERDGRLRIIRFVCGKRILAIYFHRLLDYRLQKQSTAREQVGLTPYQEACLDTPSRIRFVEEKVREDRALRLRAVQRQIRSAAVTAARRASLEQTIAMHGDIVQQNREAVVLPTVKRGSGGSTPATTRPRPRVSTPSYSFLDAFHALSPKRQKEVLAQLTERDALSASLVAQRDDKKT